MLACIGSLPFLEREAQGEQTDLGERAVIIGGGNAAIDSARTAMRMGATATVIYRRERKDMPAIEEEVDAAEEEGANFIFLAAPHRIIGEHGAVKGDRGHQDAVGCVRHIRAPATGRYR